MGDGVGRKRTSSLRYASVHDQLATGRKPLILTVVDTFSRLLPVIDPRFSYRGEDVVATLERACRKIGYPKTIRVDNGSEFISRDIDLWAYQRGVILDFSRPGKPTDNAFIEHSNHQRYHESLDNVTPADAYFDSAPAIIKQRERIKRQTIEHP